MLILKEIRKNNKLFIKTNKNIFIRYKSDNNYLIYFFNQNKIISIKDCLIKEDLIYSNNYNLINNNYTSLEGLELLYNSLDILKSYQSGGNINTNNLPCSNSPITSHLFCSINGLSCNIRDLFYNTSSLPGSNSPDIKNLPGRFDKDSLFSNNFINNSFNNPDSNIEILNIENDLNELNLNYNKLFKKQRAFYLLISKIYIITKNKELT